jgi:hypothetical protein
MVNAVTYIMTLIGEDNMADAKIYSVSEQSKLAKVRG